MHLERELKIITCIFLGLLVFTDIFICAAAKSPFLICLVVSLAMTALYVAIILVLRSFYRRVGGIRRSTKKLITQETTDNEGLELIRNEMLSEGEFGKLSEAIYDLYTSILETADREKQQKLYQLLNQTKIFSKDKQKEFVKSIKKEKIIEVSKNRLRENRKNMKLLIPIRIKLQMLSMILILLEILI